MKLEDLLQSIPQIEPSASLHSNILKRVQELPKLATLGCTLGNVQIQRKDSPELFLAKSGDALFAGDSLTTGEGGKTFVIFKDGTQVWLNQKTTLEFSPSSKNIFIPLGEILAFVTRRKKGEQEFRVGTPAGLVQVMGTEFDTVVSKEKITILTVLEGIVNFKNDKGEAKLKKNTQSRAKADTQPTAPIKVETYSTISWTEDLVNHSKHEGRDIPYHLVQTPKENKQPINIMLIIYLLLGAAVLGYILGYIYGKF